LKTACYRPKTKILQIPPSWIGRHFKISVKRYFIHHLKVFPKYIRLSKLVENCKFHILNKKYTRWRHFGLAVILKYQLSKISYIISRHFQNVFIHRNRLKNAKTISQKWKCTSWRHLELAAILKHQLKKIHTSSQMVLKVYLPI
jgi:hypothetical protein